MTNYANQITVNQINNGTSASVSTYHRGDNTWAATSGAGSLVPVATAQASSSASLEFKSCFSPSYYQYLILFNAILPATDNVYLQFQLATGGGTPTYVTTGYDWNINGFVNTSFAGASATGGGGTFVALGTTNGSFGVSNGAGGVNGSVNICNINNSSIIANGVSSTGYLITGNTNPAYSSGYFLASSAAYTGVKFFFSSGNIASGIIDIYGILQG